MQKRKISFSAVITLIVLVAVSLGAAFGFGLIGSTPDFSQPLGDSNNDVLAPTPKAKVARPKSAQNKNYTQLLQEGNSFLSKNKLEDALADFQEAARVSPKESIPYEKIGDIYALQGNYDKSAKSYEIGFNLNTKNRKLYLKQIHSLLNARKITEAQALLAKAQVQSPEVLYLNALIDAYFNNQQKARDALIAITRFSPAREEATDLMPLAVIKSNADQLEKMYQNFDLAKESPLSYLQALLAKNFNLMGEYGLAIETAFNGLKVQNDYRDIWIILGHSFLKQQKWSDAKDALTKALALDQKSASAYMYRGIAAVHNNQVRDGISDFTQALAMGYKPRIEVILALGDAYYILGLNQKALSYYQQVLTTDPESLAVFKRPISIALFTPSDIQVANDLVAIAMKNFSNKAMVLGWKTILLARSGNLLDARTTLEKALALDSQDIYVIIAQAELERAVGNSSQAEASYRRVIDLVTDTDDVLVEQYAQQNLELLKQNAANSSLSLE